MERALRAELTVRDQANVLLSQESTASSCGPLRALVHAVHHIRSSGQPTQKWVCTSALALRPA